MTEQPGRRDLDDGVDEKLDGMAQAGLFRPEPETGARDGNRPPATPPTDSATGSAAGNTTGRTGGPATESATESATVRSGGSDKDFFAALGGWGALLDVGLPWIAFLVVYGVTDDLRLALIVAIAGAAAVAVLRLVRRQPLRNIVGGFVGVLISAWVANRTGRAEDVYLPGLLTNIGYGLLYLITVLIRWPLFGVLYGVITQTGSAWRRDPAMLRGFNRATLVFVGLFAIRLVVQVPLYLTGSLNALGIAKIGLGLPFYALALWLAYAALRGSLAPEKWDEVRDHATHLLRGNKK